MMQEDGLLPLLDPNDPLDEHKQRKVTRAEQKIARERWEEYQRQEEFYRIETEWLENFKSVSI